MSQRTIYTTIFIVAIMVVLVWGGLEATAGPKFCGSCHIMQDYKQSHAISQHSALSCSDCHVPHSLVSKIVYKAKSGSRDIYHTIKKDYPAVINIKEDSKKVLINNCLSCHMVTNEQVHPGIEGEECFACHRNLAHPKNKETADYIY